MDDFISENLYDSKNEWSARLVSLLSPQIIIGINAIFSESCELCAVNKEQSKYLQTFQNMLTRVPKWNSVTIENERKRIILGCGCNYLEDLITCVHIIQLKILTNVRVGNKQKKIDITTPKLDDFIHKVYINMARKIYKYTYLYEIMPPHKSAEIQKHNYMIEKLAQECIITTIRDSIPVDSIIKAYLDETVEEEEEIIIENIPNPLTNNNNTVDVDTTPKIDISETIVDNNNNNNIVEKEKEKEVIEDHIPIVQSIINMDEHTPVTKLTFNDFDHASDGTSISAPKTDEHLQLKQELKEQQQQSIIDNDIFDLNKPINLFSEPDAELSDIEEL